MISLIVARDRNGAIGKGNEIPWYVPADLGFFKQETLGGACIMGRRTWDSLPFRPLKNRENIVVTSQGVDHDHVVGSVQDAVALAYELGYRRVYGMGGAGIYREMLGMADRLLITEVDLEVEGADTWFPEVPTDQFRAIGGHVIQADGPRCELVEYLRI